MGSTLPVTSTTSDDDDSTTDSPQTESASASSASVADTSSSSSSTQGLEDCGALGCEACTECVGEPGQPCDDLEETCDGLAGCPSAVDCLLYCATTGICGPCCESITPESAEAAIALHTCRSDQCVVNLAVCDDFAPGDCTP